MGRPNSLDPRERVVDAVCATSRRQAAARFGVAVATAIRWAAAVEATGTVAAVPRAVPVLRSLIRTRRSCAP